ncbi:MAG: DNA helicase RecG [Candidatus Harrisonbacteria bacterium CG10_big_fil_rev_8_21_14_0_10_40_38]|uniref:ATP-dependent DNA helicase RecG n=1 Tax=Candidatus Harrisonbacteria bacterium CG10_big_fil_rev_8_21_14_0_10_40_38 TaxID=1974583 RepID=A0A2H0URA9_9BACT|nr:MAG: DNA helicase RecG [Candidatus Harrisonbacteria bacterium CG10_big_fil_rev_8_21_14_0_10_40_38]
MITLSTELLRIRGISPSLIAHLKKLKIETVRDLLWHFPTRYEDFSRITQIADLSPNQSTTVSGVIKKVSSRYLPRKRFTIVEAVITDSTGEVKAIWFNQPYITRILRPGLKVNFAGKVVIDKISRTLCFSNPTHEIYRGYQKQTHTAGLIPIYPETRGLTSRGIRYLIQPILKVLPKIPDFIPEHILKSERLPSINNALNYIHFPKNLGEVEQAKKRFSFESLLLIHLNNLKIRAEISGERAHSFLFSDGEIDQLLSSLPFTLTKTQVRSLEEILEDLKKQTPMNRLLQGDVGSGKTVIAAIAALSIAKTGKQVAIMAPTEILARQHYATFKKLFGEIMKEWGVSCAFISGGISASARKLIAASIKASEINVVIGTHSLIQKSISFSDLAFVVVDEQQRFGVAQRARLLNAYNTEPVTASTRKTSTYPHFLSMSATPIPRTVSLTIFGDLNISTIEELPSGRKPIVTKVVDPENRDKAYLFMREQIKKGRQVFIVCPRIENSTETESKLLIDKRQVEVKTVQEEYDRLSKEVFPDLRVSMIHGRMKAKEKDMIMKQFSSGYTNILVSTSVIEVGVDVPNAAVMVIEGADRFGLAQLYQFRGRIGRGEHQSFCLLFSESSSSTTAQRLGALLKARNGFELAELDLKLRGPGEFLGDRQTGMPDIAMNALMDPVLIRSSRQASMKLLSESPTLDSYPLLKERLSLIRSATHLE